MDDFTLEHLRKWIEYECYPFTREDSEFQECEKLMVAKYNEDSEFWQNAGWNKLYWSIQETVNK